MIFTPLESLYGRLGLYGSRGRGKAGTRALWPSQGHSGALWERVRHVVALSDFQA